MDNAQIIELAHECAQEAWRQADDQWRDEVRDRFRRAQEDPTRRNTIRRPLPHASHLERLVEMLDADRRELVSDQIWSNFRESYRAELRRRAFKGVRRG